MIHVLEAVARQVTYMGLRVPQWPPTSPQRAHL